MAMGRHAYPSFKVILASWRSLLEFSQQLPNYALFSDLNLSRNNLQLNYHKDLLEIFLYLHKKGDLVMSGLKN
jgi:hypothetical protein